MSLTCHLTFDGQCEAAFKTYRRVLGGQVKTMLEFGSSPLADQVPLDWARKIMHATLVLDGAELIGSDAFPNAYASPRGFCVLFAAPNAAEGRCIFEALADGGQVQFPFQATFWSPGYGVLVDRFGVPWEVNSEAG